MLSCSAKTNYRGGAIVNAIIDLLFIKSNRFVNRVLCTHRSLPRTYGYSRTTIVPVLFLYSYVKFKKKVNFSTKNLIGYQLFLIHSLFRY